MECCGKAISYGSFPRRLWPVRPRLPWASFTTGPIWSLAKTACNTARLNGSTSPLRVQRCITTKAEKPTLTGSLQKSRSGSRKLKACMTATLKAPCRCWFTTSKPNSVSPTLEVASSMPKTSAAPPPWWGRSCLSTRTAFGNTPKKTSSGASRACSSTKFCTAATGKKHCAPPPPASPFPSGSQRACTATSLNRGQRKRPCTFGMPLAPGT